LKQVLADAFRAKSKAANPRNEPPVEVLTVDHPTAGPHAASRSGGMKVVILNWKEGENDPFTYVNRTMSAHFGAWGKNVEIIEICDRDWIDQLARLLPSGVEFAFTWQGLGSRTMSVDGGQNLWDQMRVPLVCLHADHPSHMPLNHELESRYCFHLYTNADFARYSNRHFRRTRGASVIDIPQLFREPRLSARTGDYFVFAKNINDPTFVEGNWQQSLDKRVYGAYMAAVEALKARLATEPYVELHDVLDELITQPGLEWLSHPANIGVYHQYHSWLEHYFRSYKSVAAVTALRDFPLRVYGRGWERIARTAPPSQKFEPGHSMADSQHLYYSRFGLVDVSPSKLLHDRTRRAMVNGTGFVSSANLEDLFADIGRFTSLFFDFRANDLQEKCAAAMHDPEGHRELAEQFASAYHNQYRISDFVTRIDDLVKSVPTL